MCLEQGDLSECLCLRAGIVLETAAGRKYPSGRLCCDVGFFARALTFVRFDAILGTLPPTRGCSCLCDGHEGSIECGRAWSELSQPMIVQMKCFSTLGLCGQGLVLCVVLRGPHVRSRGELLRSVLC